MLPQQNRTLIYRRDLNNGRLLYNLEYHANHIPPATAEQIICDTLRFLQFQSICDTLRADRNKYIRWLSLSRQMLHPAEFAREITKNLCHCRLDEESYHLMGKWLLAFFRKKDYRVIYPQKIRTDLLHQQHCHCAICNELITDHAELDHIIPCLQWKKAAAKQIFSSARHGMSRLCLRIVEFAVKTADRRCKRLTHGYVRGYYTIKK